MSAAFYAVLDREVKGMDPLALDGKALSTAQEQLDALAVSLGTRPLMEFVSFAEEEQAAMAEEFGIPTVEVTIRKEEWFDPSEGIETLQAMLRHLASGRHPLAGDSRVKEELNHLLRILAGAEAAGARFHMSVSI